MISGADIPLVRGRNRSKKDDWISGSRLFKRKRTSAKCKV